MLFVTGVSGTGKTTVLRELAALGVSTIGIDETDGLTWWVDKKTGDAFVGDDVVFDQAFLAKYDWRCSIERLQALLFASETPVVVCGSADNVTEIMSQCDRTILLHCSPDVFLARIEARTDNEYGKTEAAKLALLGYYEEYNETVVAHGAIVVDASQPVEEVVKQVRMHLYD